MKRNFIIVMVSMVVSMSLFVSCLNDDEDISYNEYLWSTIGFFERESETSYYIASDKGAKFYVTNYQDLLDLGYKPSQRVYALFASDSAQPAVSGGYIAVSYVYPVLEKGVVALTDANSDEIGDNLIDMDMWWTSKNYLNIYYHLRTSATNTHYLNLVTVDNPKKTEAGYQYLEFRHNLNGNRSLNDYYGVVSFDVSEYLGDPDLKGFIIRVNTLGEGEKFYKYDFPSESGEAGSGFRLPEAGEQRLVE